MEEKARTQSVNGVVSPTGVAMNLNHSINHAANTITTNASGLVSGASPSSANAGKPFPTACIKQPSNPDDIVTLSVGGQRVSTTWGTLISEEGVFRRLGNKNNDPVKSIWWTEGLYFVDRDGSHFRHILNHMRGTFRLAYSSRTDFHVCL